MINAHLAATLGPMRAPFLLLVPVCVSLGWAAAVHDGYAIELPHLLLAALGALAAHVSVNALNEWDLPFALQVARRYFATADADLTTSLPLASAPLGRETASSDFTSADDAADTNDG